MGSGYLKNVITNGINNLVTGLEHLQEEATISSKRGTYNHLNLIYNALKEHSTVDPKEFARLGGNKLLKKWRPKEN